VECTNKDQVNPQINVFVKIQSTVHIDAEIYDLLC